MSHTTNGSDHLQEPALRYARQDFPIIRDSVTVGEALNIIRREGVGERIIYFYIINDEGQLTGIIPTRRLLTSTPQRPILSLNSAAPKTGRHSLLDDILVIGTDERLLKKIRQLCPQAKAIVTADSHQKALELYNLGADFVFIPRIHSLSQVAQIIESGLSEGLDNVRAEQIAQLKMRDEVLA